MIRAGLRGHGQVHPLAVRGDVQGPAHRGLAARGHGGRGFGGFVQPRALHVQAHRGLEVRVGGVVQHGLDGGRIAGGEEDRRVQTHEEGALHPNLGRGLAGARVAGDGAGGHDPGGHVVGQGDAHHRAAVGAGVDPAAPIRGIAVIAAHGDHAQHIAAFAAASAHAGAGGFVGFGQPLVHQGAVRVHIHRGGHAQRLPGVEGLEQVEGVGQQVQQSLVHQGQGDLRGHGLARGIARLDGEGHGVAGLGLLPVGGDLDLQPLGRAVHGQIGGAHPIRGRGLAGGLERGHGDIHAGGHVRVNGHLEHGVARRQGLHPGLSHPLALDGDQSHAVGGEGRRHQHPRGVAGFIRLLVGEERQPGRVGVGPQQGLGADGPHAHTGLALAALRVGRGGDEAIQAALRRGEGEGRAALRVGDHGRGRVHGGQFQFRLPTPAAVRVAAAHRVPVLPKDLHLHRLVGLGLAGGREGHQVHGQRLARLAEPAFGLEPYQHLAANHLHGRIAFCGMAADIGDRGPHQHFHILPRVPRGEQGLGVQLDGEAALAVGGGGMPRLRGLARGLGFAIPAAPGEVVAHEAEGVVRVAGGRHEGGGAAFDPPGGLAVRHRVPRVIGGLHGHAHGPVGGDHLGLRGEFHPKDGLVVAGDAKAEGAPDFPVGGRVGVLGVGHQGAHLQHVIARRGRFGQGEAAVEGAPRAQAHPLFGHLAFLRVEPDIDGAHLLGQAIVQVVHIPQHAPEVHPLARPVQGAVGVQHGLAFHFALLPHPRQAGQSVHAGRHPVQVHETEAVGALDHRVARGPFQPFPVGQPLRVGGAAGQFLHGRVRGVGPRAVGRVEGDGGLGLGLAGVRVGHPDQRVAHPGLEHQAVGEHGQQKRVLAATVHLGPEVQVQAIGAGGQRLAVVQGLQVQRAEHFGVARLLGQVEGGLEHHFAGVGAGGVGLALGLGQKIFHRQAADLHREFVHVDERHPDALGALGGQQRGLRGVIQAQGRVGRAVGEGERVAFGHGPAVHIPNPRVQFHGVGAGRLQQPDDQAFALAGEMPLEVVGLGAQVHPAGQAVLVQGNIEVHPGPGHGIRRLLAGAGLGDHDPGRARDAEGEQGGGLQDAAVLGVHGRGEHHLVRGFGREAGLRHQHQAARVVVPLVIEGGHRGAGGDGAHPQRRVHLGGAHGLAELHEQGGVQVGLVRAAVHHIRVGRQGRHLKGPAIRLGQGGAVLGRDRVGGQGDRVDHARLQGRGRGVGIDVGAHPATLAGDGGLELQRQRGFVLAGLQGHDGPVEDHGDFAIGGHIGAVGRGKGLHHFQRPLGMIGEVALDA